MIEATLVNAAERQQPAYDAKLYCHLGQDGYGSTLTEIRSGSQPSGDKPSEPS